MQHPFDLSFISFSEGRIRPITPIEQDLGALAQGLNGNLNLPNGKEGSIDYYITDHRSDVRMILTEEEQWIRATASMEEDTYVRYAENELFNNSIAATAVAKSAAPGWASNTSQQISKLNSAQKTGPNKFCPCWCSFRSRRSALVGVHFEAAVAGVITRNLK